MFDDKQVWTFVAAALVATIGVLLAKFYDESVSD
jgi:hypothetical protein